MPCSRKLIDKYHEALVDYRKGGQFIYPQLFVVIGMLDL